MSTIRFFSLWSLFISFLVSPLFSQECGPSCPVCSGGSQGALLSRSALLISGLYAPISEEENAVISARYGLLTWLDVGMGYAIKSKKLLWSLRFQPLKEGENRWQPGIVLGTGSVQTGGSDQSAYAQLTKSWEFGESFALRINAGAATLVPKFDRVFGLAGITTSIFEKFSVFANYDGRSFHEGVSWVPLDWLTVSGLLIESRDPAVSIAFKWDFSTTEVSGNDGENIDLK